MFPPIQHSVLERFLRYVQIDTQSNPFSPTFPSTEKQKDLARVLVQELLALGVADAHMDEYGYVYATVPATVTHPVPTICFCSHLDTSSDSSGTDVKPIIHYNYKGQDLVLPDDPSIIIRLQDHPNLGEQMGNDIITASGLTLLGADNKAGIAEIMDATQYLMQHPEVPHGTLKILFTPDEEIGRGVNHVDLQKLGAHFGYTVDGERRGSFEDETFSADAVTLIIDGVSTHPGFAKGKMESAVKIASEIVARLPKDRLAPEAVDGRAGFIHPATIEGLTEKAAIHFIVRDFTDEGLVTHETFLKNVVEEVMQNYPHSRYEMRLHQQYRNMKKVLDQYPQVTTNALEAIRRAGIEPIHSSIRGGTDGARLSYMGLPCPNIFAGEHAFHSKQEWVSVQDMQKAVEVIVHLAMIWAE
ncbi:peptidase T [Haliscomenobacter hydrossis]|uniref:Peptidase T n=1 Tax=Haliscomenobacter hydrossis (strain ATCC 27775 / DSM 1100 / LMG 10767 / O) TaxID=760192 RepID=F4L4P3_HALH1|nr:peptidase T [Haliscomenobacter hydrossis]AEE52991.1 peptidase T [Haliscomenobacter hydrossis DSM 1100]